jgi:hypothetical protein
MLTAAAKGELSDFYIKKLGWRSTAARGSSRIIRGGLIS